MNLNPKSKIKELTEVSFFVVFFVFRVVPMQQSNCVIGHTLRSAINRHSVLVL